MGAGNYERSHLLNSGHGRSESHGSRYMAQPDGAKAHAKESDEMEDDNLYEHEEENLRP